MCGMRWLAASCQSGPGWAPGTHQSEFHFWCASNGCSLQLSLLINAAHESCARYKYKGCGRCAAQWGTGHGSVGQIEINSAGCIVQIDNCAGERCPGQRSNATEGI